MRGRGAGGGSANWEDDPPLIIGRCQSLHNTENSAPTHAEHPRSLSSWLSTHGFNCAHCRKSNRRGVKFILEVQGNRPLRSDPTTWRCFRFTSVPKLCVSLDFSCTVHFTHSRPEMWRSRRDISEGTIQQLFLYLAFPPPNETTQKSNRLWQFFSLHFPAPPDPEFGLNECDLIATYLRRFSAVSSR